MADLVADRLGAASTLLDLGSGYGGSREVLDMPQLFPVGIKATAPGTLTENMVNVLRAPRSPEAPCCSTPPVRWTWAP